jgi:hypothetical protein
MKPLLRAAVNCGFNVTVTEVACAAKELEHNEGTDGAEQLQSQKMTTVLYEH